MFTLLLVAFLLPDPADGMEYTRNGDKLIMSGSVDGLDYVRFTRNLDFGIKTVVLTNSLGGDHDAMLNIVYEIRRRKLVTVGKGYCLSACALMFLGGVERRLDGERSFVAFHGYYKWLGTGNSDRPSMEHYGELARLMSEMTGGKLDPLIDAILMRPRHGFIYFFNDKTLQCEGTEKHRPWDCGPISQTATEMGVVTELVKPEVVSDK